MKNDKTLAFFLAMLFVIVTLFLLTPNASAQSNLPLIPTAPAPPSCFATHDDGTTVFDSADAHAVQQAVDSANSGDTVKIAGTCAGVEARAGLTQTVYISKALTLSGGYTTTNWNLQSPASHPATLDARASGRVIYASHPLTVEHLTIQNGKVTDANGGGIYAGHTLWLISSQISNSIASRLTSSGSGGGVYVVRSATFSGTSFFSNTAGDSGGGAYVGNEATINGSSFLRNTAVIVGGGAYVAGTAMINGTSIISNRANNHGGGVFAAAAAMISGTNTLSNTANARGGGMYVIGTLAINGANFYNNTAGESGGGVYAGSDVMIRASDFIRNTAIQTGGAVHVYVYGIGAVVVDQSRLVNNLASGGGGIWALQRILTVTHGLLEGNRADNVGGIVAERLTLYNSQVLSNTSSSTSSGGLWIGNDFVISNTTFINNIGAEGGAIRHVLGGVGRIVNSLFARNVSSDRLGSVLRNDAGTVELVHTTIASPTLISGAAIYGVAGTLNLTNTIITNHAIGIERVGGIVSEDYTLFDGISIPLSGTVLAGSHSLTGTATFVDAANDDYHLTAASAAVDHGINAGVIDDFDGDPRSQGGGFDIGYDESPYTYTARCWATADNGTTLFNSADAHAVQQAVDAAPNGGTVKIAGTCAGVEARAGLSQTVYISKALTLSGGYTTTNWSLQSSLSNPTVLDADGGGRVIRSREPLALDNLLITNGRANGGGGGIFASNSLTLTTGVQVISNTASTQGGGIYVSTGTLLIQNSHILSNTADVGNGGGIALNTSLALLENSWLQNNRSNGASGGGLWSIGAVVMTNTRVISNTAARDGGAIYSNREVRLDTTWVINNRSTRDGGGLYIGVGESVLTHSFVHSNTTGGDGGGVRIAGGNLAVTNSLVDHNQANQGAGLYVGSQLTLGAGAVISNNHALTYGGGVYVSDAATSTLILNGGEIISNTADLTGGGVYIIGATSRFAYNSGAVSQNQAGGGGGVYHASGLLDWAEGVAIEGNRATVCAGLHTFSPLSLTGVHFLNNIATNNGGGGCFAADVTLNRVRFVNNVAEEAGGAVFHFPTTLISSTFVNNIARTYDGGGAHFFGTSSLTDTIFTGNQAEQNGGGAVFYSPAQLANTTFNNNSAKGSGGAIWAETRPLTVTNSRIEGNQAANVGGIVADRLTLVNSQVLSNTSHSQSSGGLRIGNDFVISNTAFINNVGREGGAIQHTLGGVGRIVNSLFARNLGPLGSALLNQAGEVTIVHSTVTSPTIVDAIALYALGGTIHVTNTIIANHDIALRNDNAMSEDYNLFFGNRRLVIGTISSGGHSVTGDPAFVDPASDNYRLTAASAAVNQAMNAGVNDDFFGGVRPQGGDFDIGYAESPYTLPELNIDDATVSEGNSGVTTLALTVTLSFAKGVTVTVDYMTVDGSATAADNDYVVVNRGIITFAPGSTSQTIEIAVLADQRVEVDETLLVRLGTSTFATINDGIASGVIINDDVAPTVTPTATPTPTQTPTPTSTSTATATATNSATPAPPTATATATATMTHTPVPPTATMTATKLPTATSTPTSLPPLIGDWVWYDQNGDGLQSIGEPPLQGITVTLYSTETIDVAQVLTTTPPLSGTVVLTTVTQLDGRYAFTTLLPGRYFLEFATDGPFVPTLCNQGSDDRVDSDACRVALSSVSRTAVFTVTAHQQQPEWDAGFTNGATIRGRAYRDLNRNNQPDAAEPPMADVVLFLQEDESANQNGQRAANAPPRTLARTVTGSDGSYRFANLTPGRYQLEIVAPTGYTAPTTILLLPWLSAGELLSGDAGLVALQPTALPTTPEPRHQIYLPLAQTQ